MFKQHIHVLPGSQTWVTGCSFHTVYVICSKWAKNVQKLQHHPWRATMSVLQYPHLLIMSVMLHLCDLNSNDADAKQQGAFLCRCRLFILRESLVINGKCKSEQHELSYYGSTPADCVKIYYIWSCQGYLGFLSRCQSGSASWCLLIWVIDVLM